MLSSSHFLIAVVIHEVDPAIYAATSSNAWMLKSPGTHNSSGTKRNFDCRLCSLLPHIIPLLESRIKSNKYFLRCFSSKKKGTLRTGILKAGTIFLPKLNSLCFFFGGEPAATLLALAFDLTLLLRRCFLVLLVVEATRKSAQLKFN